MTRIVTWLLGTVTAVTLLFGYHTSTVRRPRPTSADGRRRQPADTARPRPARRPARAPRAPPVTTVTGAVVQTRWGPVQVAITVADGKITAVDVPQYPNGNGKDEEINADALPILMQETLSAQSADIDMVSGATVTSDGYVQSLQSALDQAGL